VFINDVRLVQWRMSSTRARVTVIAGLIAALLIVLQVAAVRAGFQGPLHSLASDYVATPKSTTVPWVGLGVALVGLSNRHRIYALAAAVALDAAFAAERWLRAGVVAFGNGPVIVLTALTVLVCWRWDGIQRATALKGIAFATLFVLATKVGDAWLRLTPINRPKVLDEYVLLADHALAQPSWLVGRALDWAGAAASGLLHWVYIELPVAALIVAPGARKEKLRRREFPRPAGPGERPSPRPRPRPYVEMRAASSFSFLDGASAPEDLVEETARREIPAVALVERNGVYGAPRFWKAARAAGVRALVGAEVSLEEREAGGRRPEARDRPRLTLYVENRTGYRNLCRPGLPPHTGP